MRYLSYSTKFEALVLALFATELEKSGRHIRELQGHQTLISEPSTSLPQSQAQMTIL